VVVTKRLAEISGFLQRIGPGVVRMEEELSQVRFIQLKWSAPVAREASSNIDSSSAHAA
jgi:hypothetical protein